MGMAAAIYCPRGSKQVPTTPQRRTRKGRTRKGKLPQSRKRQQGLQPPQQSNARREARKKSRKIKRNPAIFPTTLRENGYPTLTTKEKKMKLSVKLHQSINKLNKRRQRSKATRHDEITRKRRASQ